MISIDYKNDAIDLTDYLFLRIRMNNLKLDLRFGFENRAALQRRRLDNFY